ncbi:MAG TPA: radical SAM protein [Thermoplasmatales archaeon]|nr:radical SAM protein [Thermoplasmatales archaeon]
MKKTKKWLKGSVYVEPLSPGCRLCAEGLKLVLLVTGLCPASCFYCPLSEKKRGKDVVYANEWKLDNESDTDKILKEAQLTEARGAGITGGDPLMVWERTKRYISLLKKEFGDGFHIHLYTSGLKGYEHIPDLVASGLDEIRFHPLPLHWSNMKESPIRDAIDMALREDIDVAIEIPSIPGKENDIVSLIEWSAHRGIKWINLNELEFSETNANELNARGFEVKDDVSAAVSGSEEMSIKIIEQMAERGFDIGLHYCSSSFKDGIQLRNRIMRRARNVARPFEIVSDEGLLIKGVIEVDSPPFVKILIDRYGIENDMLVFDNEKHRIEIAPWILEEIAGDLAREGIKCFIVEEYPTADRLEVERIPL